MALATAFTRRLLLDVLLQARDALSGARMETPVEAILASPPWPGPHGPGRGQEPGQSAGFTDISQTGRTALDHMANPEVWLLAGDHRYGAPRHAVGDVDMGAAGADRHPPREAETATVAVTCLAAVSITDTLPPGVKLG